MTPGELRERTSKLVRKVAGIARRVAVEVAVGGLWQISGHEGESDDEVPAFQGIGFASRPREGEDAPEAVVVRIAGASGHPVIVATRDEDLRKVHAEISDLEADETAIFNSGAFIKIDKLGNVSIRAKAGGTVTIDDGSGAAELPTLADVQAIRSDLDNHSHTYIPGNLAVQLTTLNPSVTAPTGTSVLKGK